ncbi:Nramp family divalent metal transporter [Patescibacteria group bacterium]|nr:Nramp family divalent metal transporter [Patescibacteria group bacterium]
MDEVKSISAKIKKFFKALGPGFITGASDDDPTGIATYTQAGASFGHSLLWTAIFSIPFMIVIQEMAGRIGMVTGKGLSGVIRHHYPKSVLYLVVILLMISNTVNIGADLGAMAASGRLIFNLPFAVWLILLVFVTLFMEIFISYETYAKYLKYLALVLFSYIIVALMITQNWKDILLSTLIPTISLNQAFFLTLVAILGTNISPYLFFWQAGEEVEEEVELHKIRAMGKGVPKVTNRDLRELKMDTTVGMVFSNLVVFFICVTAASTLGGAGLVDVQTSAQAAEALRPLAGDLAFSLFALGVIGSGLLAVPVLAGSASYALAEAFGWREGLYRKFTQAHGFYGVITLATLIGLLVNFTSIEPFKMLIYSAAINSLLAPPLLVMILLITNNTQIMGKYINSKLTNVLGTLITVLMITAGAILIYSLF